MGSASGHSRSLKDRGVGIAVAMAVMNVTTYAHTMVAARLLGPQAYGAFASMLNLLIVVGVLSLGLQTTAARRIAAEPEHIGQIEREILRVTYRVSLLLGVLMLALAPLISYLLRLDSVLIAALLGVAVVPTTIMGGQAGVLQGERRWTALGLLYAFAGVGRLGIGAILILWQPTALTATLSVAIGAWAPAVVGWLALRSGRAQAVESSDHGFVKIVTEVLHNSQALLAFLALSNVDVVVARMVLPEHDAGLYAAGLILTKAVLFLPQFVVVVAFPAMASPSQRRRALLRGLAMTATLGVCATAATYLLASIALIFVGGDAYAEIESKIWLWALLGTSLAMLQVLVYAVLARRNQNLIVLVWLALITFVAISLGTVDSLTGLLATILVVIAVAILTLFTAMWLTESRGDIQPAVDPSRP